MYILVETALFWCDILLLMSRREYWALTLQPGQLLLRATTLCPFIILNLTTHQGGIWLEAKRRAGGAKPRSAIPLAWSAPSLLFNVTMFNKLFVQMDLCNAQLVIVQLANCSNVVMFNILMFRLSLVNWQIVQLAHCSSVWCSICTCWNDLLCN